MCNDQLFPAYTVQVAVADVYIAVIKALQYRFDIDCFILLMEVFRRLYGFYPKYPVADADCGSFDNYIYCQEKGIEKYMKYTMYKKVTTDKKRDNPFQAVKFKMDETGNLICPNNRKFKFSDRRPVKEDKYGRQEEIYHTLSLLGFYEKKSKNTIDIFGFFTDNYSSCFFVICSDLFLLLTKTWFQKGKML